MKSFDKEIVSGSILRSVWKLSWPLVLINLANGMHGFVDHILVGHFVGTANNAGNAGIGVAWQVFLVAVVLVVSLFHGTNVLVARCAGKQDRATLSRVFYSTLTCSVAVLFLVVAPLGYFLSPWMLGLVEVKDEVGQYALPYLRILFTAGAPLFLMFMITGAMNASGDPRTPLKLAILSTLLNIGISLVLIPGWGPIPAFGTIGAALGTVIAPTITVLLALYLIVRGHTIIAPPRPAMWIPDLRIMATVVRIGVPTGIQGVLLNIGGVFLIRYIGLLPNGSAAQAAYSIGYAQLFSLVTWIAFGLRVASGTLMGQNIGAGDPERGKQSVRLAAMVGSAWATLIGVVFWLFPSLLLGWFNVTTDPVLGMGRSLLQYLSASGVALAATLALTGALQGAGETKKPMYIAFITQILVLLGICQGLYALNRLYVEGIWAAILVAQTSRLAMTWWVFRTKAWAYRHIEIPTDPEGLPEENAV